MRFQSYSSRDWALLILRVALGITLIVHGYPKLLDAGPAAFARYLRIQHIPAPLLSAWFMALVEFVGGLMLVAGFQVTWAGWAAAVERVFIAWFFKIARSVDFVAARGVGWEFDFVLLGIAIAVALLGPGAVTLESFLKSRRNM